jgi:hypothetical protein
MLDFDFVCRRDEPSVACLVYPFTGDHKLKFYWGHKEILIPGTHYFKLVVLFILIFTKLLVHSSEIIVARDDFCFIV